MTYKLLPENHPMLFEKMEPFDFANPPVDPWELAENMVKTMREKRGLGLSANQVGLPYRMFVMEGEPALACFNPKVIDMSETMIMLEEGCLSYPNLWIKINRPRLIKVRFTDPNGDTTTHKFDGMTARCFLHELDHLDGLLFFRNASRIHLEQAKRRKKKVDRRGYA